MVIKVSSKSVPKSVAGAIAALVREKGTADIQAVGAGAVNQTAKAVAIAHMYFKEEGAELVCIPTFTEFEVNGEEKTGLTFTVKLI